MSPKKERAAIYDKIIKHLFADKYQEGAQSVAFHRDEIKAAAETLGVQVPDNVGDVPYAYRFRRELPKQIRDHLQDGEEWVIRITDQSQYAFERAPLTNIKPQENLYRIKIPDATPEIVNQWTLSDEQALLAKVRYNRLIDLFTGLTTYSLQNHLRTKVDRKQIEIDELYVGVHSTGAQFAVPVQAKRGKDKIGRVQVEQDVEYCKRKMGMLGCRPIAVQFMADAGIAMFELMIDGAHIRIANERHYELVPASDIRNEDLVAMRQLANLPPLS